MISNFLNHPNNSIKWSRNLLIFKIIQKDIEDIRKYYKLPNTLTSNTSDKSNSNSLPNKKYLMG